MNRKAFKRPSQTILVWNYSQARAALPYIASIVGSLREHQIRALEHDARARKLASRPGRHNRAALIAHDEEIKEAAGALERFQDALHELESIGIALLDATRGEAMIPFVYDNELAWFVYDLFDERPLHFWRYQSDSLEVRRPVTEVMEGFSGIKISGSSSR